MLHQLSRNVNLILSNSKAAEQGVPATSSSSNSHIQLDACTMTQQPVSWDAVVLYQPKRVSKVAFTQGTLNMRDA